MWCSWDFAVHISTKCNLPAQCCAQNYLDVLNRGARHSNVSSGALVIKSRLKSRLRIDAFVQLGSKIPSRYLSTVREEVLSSRFMLAKELNKWGTCPGGNLCLINSETAFEIKEHLASKRLLATEASLREERQSQPHLWENPLRCLVLSTMPPKDKRHCKAQVLGAGWQAGLFREWSRIDGPLHSSVWIMVWGRKAHLWPDKLVHPACCKASSIRQRPPADAWGGLWEENKLHSSVSLALAPAGGVIADIFLSDSPWWLFLLWTHPNTANEANSRHSRWTAMGYLCTAGTRAQRWGWLAADGSLRCSSLPGAGPCSSLPEVLKIARFSLAPGV